MRLRKLKLENFRCYKNEIEISFEDFTCIIGSNDIGKSTIFDALDIFFNLRKMDANDISKNTENKQVTITCMFDQLPRKVIIDSTYETDLANEFLLNRDGLLEIKQEYICNQTSGKLSKTIAKAMHPATDEINNLLELKHPALLKLAKALEVDLEDVDNRINAEIRHAIWQHVGTDQLALKEIPLDKEGGKQVIESLSNFFPSFALFKSDRASTDQDPEAQDPLKAAIKEAVKTVQGELDTITQRVEDELRKIADLTLQKINEMDPNLATTLDPKIEVKDLSGLFKTNIVGDEGIPLNKRGTGVKRLILLNFFRAKAEQLAKNSNQYSLIYAVEEPETGQHPKYQKMLIEALRDISEHSQNQVFITTHSPMLARTINTDSIKFIQITEDGSRSFASGGTDDINKEIAKTLGVLPDHSIKIFIGVEGENDIRFWRSLSNSLCADAVPNIPDLSALEEDGKVLFIPLGGSNLAYASSRFAGLNVAEYHLYDRDNPHPQPAKYQDAIDAINARPNASAACTNKREMENYLAPECITQYYDENGIQINIPQTFADFDDVPVIVARAVHDASNHMDGWIQWDQLTDEKKRKKESRVKKVLNQEVPIRMTHGHLLTTDPNNEIIGWFENMNAIINE